MLLAAVYADGGICLDILQNQWSPIYDVSAILTSIQVGDEAFSCSGSNAVGKQSLHVGGSSDSSSSNYRCDVSRLGALAAARHVAAFVAAKQTAARAGSEMDTR